MLENRGCLLCHGKTFGQIVTYNTLGGVNPACGSEEIVEGKNQNIGIFGVLFVPFRII